jgi:predicted transport protein
MDGGFKISPLKLNSGLGQLDTWNENSIKTRAGKLAESALDVWQSPKLSEAALLPYRRDGAVSTDYTITDHPQLLTPAMSGLFEGFRKQVLALNPCVTEEFLKLYVAYKAETNFVDVVPQAKRLRLSLNIDFSEINDPKGIAKDVTNLGRWGNGDVEVTLSTLNELPYALGLVRQAFEKQMGNGTDS